MSIDDPAEERLVVALTRRGDPQLLELVVDQLVDVVGLGLVGERERQALGQHDELRADGVRLEPGHHERLAALAGGDESVGADRGRDVVIRQENGQAGDVAVGAVGVAGPHGELLGRALAVEDGPLGIEVDADDFGQLGGVVVGRAGFDPAVQRLVELAARLEPLAAGVIDGARRLREQGAVRGHGQVDPAPDHLAGQAEVVAFGVEAEERDAKAVLAPRRPVAASGVAAGPHENRHDVEPEAERRLHRRLRDLHRHGDRLAAVGDRKRRRAVGRRVEDRADAPAAAWRRPA